MADDYDPASPTLETDGNACKQFLLDKENFMKPEKVKSRWRRNSEMETQEFNSLAPVTDNSTCIIENQDVSIKPKNCPNFDNLEENLYLFARRKTKRRKEVRRLLCECTVPREGEVACGEECLNRLLMIECGSRCVTGEACSNRRFQKRQYVKTQPFSTEQKGHGLRVLEDVPRGSFIIEYVGEVLNTSLFEKRVKLYAREKETHYYFMALSSDAIIDARNKGNLSRFINHSCDPNCETQKWTVNGDLRVGFFAKRDIKADEELTFDYQLQRYGREAQKCFCKSENCKGFIGLTGGDEISMSTDSIKKESKNKKLRKSDKEDKEKVLEEVMLEEEIEKLCINGLRNKEHTLILARLMVRAEDAATRQKLLDIILGTTEIACLRLFLDYHGLTILMCWMADVTDDQLKFKILEALSVLPVFNKNMLLESKVYDLVEKWANCKREREDGCAYDKETIKKLKSCDTSDSETDNSALLDSSKSDLVHSSCDSVQNPAVFLSDEEHSSDNKTSDNNTYSDEESPSDNSKTQSTEIANLAKNLLSSWKDLKEEFRIPRRVDKKDDNCNGDKKPLEKSSDKVENVKSSTQPTKGINSESSCSPIEEKPQEIKVVCPNFSSKYYHSSSRIKEEKHSLFSKMQHRKKHILYPVSTHNDYKVSNNDYKVSNNDYKVSNNDYKVSNNDNYNYPSGERESNLHYIYQPPPPALLPTRAPPQGGICTVPPQKAPETIPPVYAPNNMLYPPHTENFKMPPPAFLGMPPPTVAPEHATNMYANSNLPPPSLMNLNVNSHQPMVPMQVNVCTPSDPVYVKETQHTSNEYMYDKPMYMPPSHPPQIFQTSQQPEQQIYPVVQENGDTTTQKPRGVPKKLPPNWKTATDSDGNVYFYHAIKRESRWDPPTPEPEDVDNGTPTYDEPKPAHKLEKTHSRRSHQKHSKRKSTTTAPADTSSREVVNNEIAKKIKELFRTKMSSYVVQCLNPYRKDDCRVAKITSNEDFKHLARKLTHFVMAKELKHCKHVEDLDANESVKFKARDYIHKYMARYGPVYRKDKCDSLGDD